MDNNKTYLESVRELAESITEQLKAFKAQWGDEAAKMCFLVNVQSNVGKGHEGKVANILEAQMSNLAFAQLGAQLEDSEGGCTKAIVIGAMEFMLGGVLSNDDNKE
jgi:hypothetical protein